MKITFSTELQPKYFDGYEQCISFLETIEREAEHPNGVFMEKDSTEAISLVLGSDRTFLVYFPPDYNGKGSFSSLGSKEFTKNLNFWLYGHHTEASPEHLIDRDLLSLVLKEFCEMVGKPSAVSWIEN